MDSQMETPYIIYRTALLSSTQEMIYFSFIGDCHSGKVSATYARSGTSDACKNSAGLKCARNQDCVGDVGGTSNFVYKLESEYTLKSLNLLNLPTAVDNSLWDTYVM